ncbi:MAG: efflux RND transporter periplasmic adaptor subunit [Muribaculaceae bacterium]|nr:efflux RND transporter periplasmic adaptor subunit [Muribaculaceae bacterium]
MTGESHNNVVKKEERTLLMALGAVVVLTAILAVAGFLFLSPPDEIIEGEADATSVRISGKLPGRVERFYVREGDRVKTGDTLVHIHSSIVEAKLLQAEAMQTAADAQNRKVDAGTRVQVIQSAYELWQQAIAAKEIARKTYDRMESLFAQSVVSAQKRDEALAAFQAADASEKAAHSQYQLAREGAQKEDRTSAEAMATAARGGVLEVQSVLDDSYLTAPCDGEIDVIYPQEGELVAMGTPIMNLLRLEDKWITFNVREELLKDFSMGKDIRVTVPALGGVETDARIYYIRDMGNYAVWRATKATGEWDSRTFKVKARPVDSIAGLRPGMTVLYHQPTR